MILVLVILGAIVSWGNTKSFGASSGGNGHVKISYSVLVTVQLLKFQGLQFRKIC